MFTRALDGTQPIAHRGGVNRLKPVAPAVDVGQLKAHPHGLGVGHQLAQFVGVVNFHRHVGGIKHRRVVHLKPRGVVRQQRVRRGVRFVKAVTGKALHEVKHLAGHLGVYAFLLGALQKHIALLGHFFGLFLAHGAAQHVRATQRVAGHNLRHLHHLLLVHHDAKGFGQNRLERGVRIRHRFAPVFARDVGGNQLHRAGTKQRVERNQIFKSLWFGVAQHALHATAFKLKHRLGLAAPKQGVHLGVIQRHVVKRKIGQ